MPELLLILAPVLQIILSVLHVRQHVAIPLKYIALTSVVLGCLMSVLEAKMVFSELADQNYRCGMPGVGCFILGLLITFFATPLICTVFWFIRRARLRTLIAN